MCFRKTELAEGVYTGGDNHMKKKSLLGILAVLMVIALALTGCGQQGEQNAGTTGSESQNSTIDEGNVDEGEVTTEPEGSENVGDEASNHNPDMKDGYYVYEVDDVEVLCKTNIWDYIDGDVWHRTEMFEDLGTYIIYLWGLWMIGHQVHVIYRRNGTTKSDPLYRKLIPFYEPILLLLFSIPYAATAYVVRFELVEYSAGLIFILVLCWELFILVGLIPVTCLCRCDNTVLFLYVSSYLWC